MASAKAHLRISIGSFKPIELFICVKKFEIYLMMQFLRNVLRETLLPYQIS
jgi:hypothetical protein